MPSFVCSTSCNFNKNTLNLSLVKCHDKSGKIQGMWISLQGFEMCFFPIHVSLQFFNIVDS